MKSGHRYRRICLTIIVLLLVSGCASAGGAAPDNAVSSDKPEIAVSGTAPETDGEDASAAGIPEIMPEHPAEGNDQSAGEAEASGEPVEALPLKELFADDFRIGVSVQAIDHWNDPTAEIGNPDKEDLIRQEFNSITFGNEWKPAYNFDAASPGLYKTDPAAEELLSWAKENDIPVRGHTLVWHSQVNPAIFAKDFKALSGGVETHDETLALDEDCLVDREELIRRLRTYIFSMMEYTYANGYADTVYAFDVLNEATDEGKPDGLRRSYWYRIIGPEYIYYCFLFAREAEMTFAREYAPLYGLSADAEDLSPIMPKLFYNDYNEWYSSRVKTIIRFLTEDRYNEGQKLCRSEVIPSGGDGTIVGDGLIDGIGMQGHLNDTQDIDQYIDALRAYDAVVDEVQITELDVGETGTGESGEQKQAAFCNAFFRALLEERKNGVNLTSVTWWGLTDNASWRVGANPLLYRGDLSPKPAYEALQLADRGVVYDAKNPPGFRDASELFYDFEPRTEEGKLVNYGPEDLGITSRGSGHQASLDIAVKINHTPDAPIGRALRVRRAENDATVRMDISRFIGETVTVSLYVMTEDASVTLGVTGDSDTPLTTVSSGSDWTMLSSTFRLNEGLSAASLYVETDGSADLCIDDVRVTAR